MPDIAAGTPLWMSDGSTFVAVVTALDCSAEGQFRQMVVCKEAGYGSRWLVRARGTWGSPLEKIPKESPTAEGIEVGDWFVDGGRISEVFGLAHCPDDGLDYVICRGDYTDPELGSCPWWVKDVSSFSSSVIMNKEVARYQPIA